MQIGIINTGTSEQVGLGAIKSQFLVIGMPLIPLGSYWCVAEGTDGDQGMQIPLNGKSVLLGYVRWWAGIGFFLCGMLALFGLKGGNAWLLGPAAALGALWGVAMFKWGKLDEEERRRRQVLQAHTGLGIDPGCLHVVNAHKIYKSLREQWTEQTGLQNWRSSVKKARGAQAGFLYALARYKAASEPSAEAEQLAAEAWGRAAQMDAGELLMLDVQGFAAQLAAAGHGVPAIPTPDLTSRTEVDADSPKHRERPERSEARRERKRKGRTPVARVLRESSRGLEVQCPSCAKSMKVKAELAGRKGRCSRCKGALRIPRPERVAA